MFFSFATYNISKKQHKKTNTIIKIITRWVAVMSPQFIYIGITVTVLALLFVYKQSISAISLNTAPLCSLSCEPVAPQHIFQSQFFSQSSGVGGSGLYHFLVIAFLQATNKIVRNICYLLTHFLSYCQNTTTHMF